MHAARSAAGAEIAGPTHFFFGFPESLVRPRPGVARGVHAARTGVEPVEDRTGRVTPGLSPRRPGSSLRGANIAEHEMNKLLMIGRVRNAHPAERRVKPIKTDQN
jgi:hypothetical protein